MLGSCWHVRPSSVQTQAGFCNSRVSHLEEPAVKGDVARLASFAACGGFAMRLLLRKTRRPLTCRSMKIPIPVLNQVSARQQSMLDRLNSHAAAQGGKCLAMGYKNCMTRVPWQCQHGHTWDATPNNVLYMKSWCPECARNGRRIPLQRLQDHARRRGGRCMSESHYNSSKTKVLWQCKLGHTWEATPGMVLYRDTWCPDCSRKGRTYKRRSLKDLQEHAASLGGLCLATTYEGVMVCVMWQCYKGHTWLARPNDVLNNKTWCPVCAGNSPLDLRRLQEHALHRGGKCLAKKYVNVKSKVDWKCERGHTWRAHPTVF